MKQPSPTPYYVNGEHSHHAPQPISTHDIIELSRAFGRFEIRIEQHGERLTSLETRATATEARPGGAGFRVTFKELLPFLWGVAILMMAGSGVLDWKLAASVLPRF
jgi:hypothetical protein